MFRKLCSEPVTLRAAEIPVRPFTTIGTQLLFSDRHPKSE